MSSETVIVGDVGGTNCRFALAQCNDQGSIQLHHSQTYPVKDHKSFDAAVHTYLNETETPSLERATFAFAGKKEGDAIAMTNLDWTISESGLRQEFGFQEANVINDWVAMANGAMVIPDSGFKSLLPGKVNYNRPVAIAGPGTGLGMAYIIPGRNPIVVATEVGHANFSPTDELEHDVIEYLKKEHGFATRELVISGPGIYRIYQALCHLKGEPVVCMKENEVVAAAEINKKSTAYETVMMFCNMVGSFAGDIALTLGAFGGVVIGGGVSKHVAPFFDASDFKARFYGTDPRAKFLADVPLRLITAHFVALYGSAGLLLKSR